MRRFAILLLLIASAFAQDISVRSVNRTQFVSQFMTPGRSVGQAIDAACSALNGQAGMVVIEGWIAAGYSVNGVPWNCSLWDMRNTAETGGGGSYKSGVELYRNDTRDASAGTVIRGAMTLRYDDQDGGINQISPPNKTQSQIFSGIYNGFDVGEHHGVDNFKVNCLGSGDCLSYMVYIIGMGGYGTGGDEGQEGYRVWNNIGDGTTTGGVPTANSVTVSGTSVTGTWTNAGNLGVRNAGLIVLNRATYTTGTISSAGMSGGVCHVTGSGTGWTALGTGAHSDLFIRINQYEAASSKFVIPITAINSDTDLSLNYVVNEIAASCPPSPTSGSYTIYKGQQITHVPKLAQGSSSATVTVANAGTIQTGDNVEESIDPNITMWGVYVTQYSPFNLNSSVGGYFQNIGPGLLESGIRVNGNSGGYKIGLRIMNTVVTGVSASTGMTTFLASSDLTPGTLHLFNGLNTSASSRNFDWDRTNDAFSWSGGQWFSGADQRIGIGTTPQPNTLAYLFWNNTNWKGVIIAPNTPAASNAVPYFGIQVAGTPLFQVEKDRTVVNNGMSFKMYSDNEVTLKFAIDGPTGNITTPGTLNLNGTGALSTTATSGSGSICMTNNCAMVTPNIGAATGTFLTVTSLSGGTVSSTGSMSFATTLTGPKVISSGYINGAVSTNNSVSGTPNLDLDTANTFFLTLTGNVTGATFSGGTNGQQVNLIICQDGTGSRTWAWNFGTTVSGFDTIGSTASKCNSQMFVRTGPATLTALASMKTNF
jgi:hypothetical protein